MDALFSSPWTWGLIFVGVSVFLIAGSLLIGRRRRGAVSARQDAYIEALLALTGGEPRRAERLLAATIEASPSDPMYFLLHASLLNQRGDSQRAARELEGLLARRDLGSEFALSAEELLVGTLLSAGRAEDAAQRARQLGEATGLDAARLERRARLATASRVYDVAQDLGARLERLDAARGQRVQALCFAAQAEDRVDAGKSDEALKLVRKALARDRRVAAAWALEGQLLLVGGKLERAREAFLEALKLDPGFGLAILPTLEDAHIDLGQVADFEAFVHQLLELHPREPVALWALGSHLVRRRHLKEGITALSEAVDVAPGFGLAQRELARARAEVGGLVPPIEIDPVESGTRCRACGTTGVHGIVRCPVCAQVGTIEFVGAPISSRAGLVAPEAQA